MRKLITLLSILYLPVTLFSQRSELGVMLGATYYLGDLNPSKQFVMSMPAGGLIYRYNFNFRWSVKVNAIFGYLRADDNITNIPQKDRNLSFRSPLFEISPQVELNFLKYQTGHKKYKFSPYLFGGICLFYFNPQAKFNDKYYDLQPLGTEGQGTTQYPDRKPYSLISFGIPFGLGFKFSPAKSINIGLEWGMRKTFTDYIDDVSKTYVNPDILRAQKSPVSALLSDRSETKHEPGAQRGNSKSTDWYSFASLTFTFKLGGSDKSCSAYPKRISYPKFFKKKVIPQNFPN